MDMIKTANFSNNKFILNKWYLDFISEDGQAMIFYSADLKWHGYRIPYTSFLHLKPKESVKVRTHLGQLRTPRLTGNSIHWSDSKFSIEGIWQPKSDSIYQRLFESDVGALDWFCHQPSSEVNLRVNGEMFHGQGYVEMLTLSDYPWRFSTEELRWGRFICEKFVIVWIETLQLESKKWLWVNGEQNNDFTISDDSIIIKDMNLELKLDRAIVLESEKKILNVVQKLLRFAPNFNHIVPVNVLKADEIKWLSRGTVMNGNIHISEGMAIHELVNFKPKIK